MLMYSALSFPCSFLARSVFKPLTCLCKVYGKEVLSTVVNDQIQDQIRELDIYKSMQSAEGANCPL